MVTQEGLFSPQRVPHGVLNATPHLQPTMDGDVLKVLVGVICKVWVYNIREGAYTGTAIREISPGAYVLVGQGVVCRCQQAQLTRSVDWVRKCVLQR